jgi:hypothetical protein
MNPLGKYASCQDLGRLEYGRLIWRDPMARKLLLNHWSSPAYPQHARFAKNRALVEMALAPTADDSVLDAALRRAGHSLRTVAREIPPVFGSI